MLKKTAKLFPIVFFVMSLGLVVYSTNSNISKRVIPEVTAGGNCPTTAAPCPDGTTLQHCNSWCQEGTNAVERWGCCHDGNECVEERWDSYDCGDLVCADGNCVEPGGNGDNCEVNWHQGDKTYIYNGQEMTIHSCLQIDARNCQGQPVSFTRYHCYGAWPEGGCEDNPSTRNFTIGVDHYQKAMCLDDFGPLPADCPIGQTDGAIGNINGVNISTDAVLWDIPEPYCQEDEFEPRSVSGQVYCQDSGVGSTKYPMPGVELDIIRAGSLSSNTSTDPEGNFSEGLADATSFAVRIQDLPDRNLPNGHPYSAMIGPTIVEKEQCNAATYEMCDPTHTINHTGFDFRYTNCEPAVGPQCASLQMFHGDGCVDDNSVNDYSTLKRGDPVSFRCSATKTTQDVYYQFKIDIVSHPDQDPVTTSIRSSNCLNFGLTFNGDYTVMCRVCTDPNDPDSCDGPW